MVTSEAKAGKWIIRKKGRLFQVHAILRGKLAHGTGAYREGGINSSGKITTNCHYTVRLIKSLCDAIDIKAEIKRVDHDFYSHSYIIVEEWNIGLVHGDDLYNEKLNGISDANIFVDIDKIERYWSKLILETEDSIGSIEEDYIKDTSFPLEKQDRYFLVIKNLQEKFNSPIEYFTDDLSKKEIPSHFIILQVPPKAIYDQEPLAININIFQDVLHSLERSPIWAEKNPSLFLRRFGRSNLPESEADAIKMIIYSFVRLASENAAQNVELTIRHPALE